MSELIQEKGKGTAERITGQVRESAGKATGDQEMESRGRGEQARGKARHAIADFAQKVKATGAAVRGFIKGITGAK
ncbi:MAG: CsbD family protein [Chloroflexi bacterium]|nr:CsbD family protein [Chloroflexota bacterium]